MAGESQGCGTCSQDIISKTSFLRKSTGALKVSVEKCIFDSGGLDGQSNTLFDAEILSFLDFGIHYSPAVTINNERYHGNLLCPSPVDISTCSVFAAICAGFSPETTPKACKEHSNTGCPRGKIRDVCGICGGDGSSCSSTNSVIALFFVLSLVIVISAFAICYYLRSRFTRAQEQFEAFRSMYDPLPDGQEEFNDVSISN